MGLVKIITSPFHALAGALGKGFVGETLDKALEQSVDKRVRLGLLTAFVILLGFAVGKTIRLIVNHKWASVVLALALAAACLVAYFFLW